MPSLESNLYLAALRGDEDEVVDLLARGADVNAADAQGNTPLHAALSEQPWALRRAGIRKPALAGLLLAHGANPNVCNRAGLTPLMKAIVNQRDYGLLDVRKDDNNIGALLAHGADPSLGVFLPGMFDLPGEHSGRAAFDNFITMLDRLFEAGLDPDRADPAGMTLLHHVCTGRLDEHHKDLLRYLKDKGADLHAAAARGHRPIHIHAATGATPAGLRLLHELGADMHAPDRTGRTPLHHVCAQQHNMTHSTGESVELIEVLMAYGQDVEGRDNNGNTPFDLLAQRILRMSERPVSDAVKEAKLDLLPGLHRLRNKECAGVSEPGGDSRRQRLAYAQRLLDAASSWPSANPDSLWSEFKTCLAQGDRDRLTALIAQHGADIAEGHDFYDVHLPNQPLLLHLAGHRETGMLETLLSSHPAIDFEQTDRDGNTALHIAVQGGSLRHVELLLAAGADVNAANLKGETALTLLLGGNRGHPEALPLLIRHGADVNASNLFDVGPLHLARTSVAAHALLDAGADPSVRDSAGRTKLHYCLARDMEPHYRYGQQPEFFIEADDRIRIMALLRQAGADLNPEDGCGQMPLHRLARDRGFGTPFEVLDAYLALGADVNLAERENGNTPLALALGYVGAERMGEMIEMFLKYGADPNACARAVGLVYMRPRSKSTKLTARRKTLEALLHYGLDVNGYTVPVPAPDAGDTLLHIMCRTGAPMEDIRLLLEHQAEVNARNHAGETPLLAALDNNTEDGIPTGTVKLLLEYDADPNAARQDDMTPLEFVDMMAAHRNIDTVRALLLDHGAEAASADVTGPRETATAALSP